MAADGAAADDSYAPRAHDRPLAHLAGRRPEAPAWYTAAMAVPVETLTATVAGATIEVLAWGDPSRPGVLLAHGMRGHARWWGPVAPLLAADRRVVSLSYSGMGGSDWRDAYSIEVEVDELFAAAAAGGIMAGPALPVFVGHSFGARAVALAAERHGARLAGAILMDSKITPTDVDTVDKVSPGSRVYPDLTVALSRFALLPDQDCANDFLLDDVARAALVEREGGWRWRFDPAIVGKLARIGAWDALARPACPVAMVYGERSAHIDDRTLDAQRRHMPEGTPFIAVPDASHHLMLDQPIAVATAIRALAWGWQQAPSGRVPR